MSDHSSTLFSSFVCLLNTFNAIKELSSKFIVTHVSRYDTGNITLEMIVVMVLTGSRQCIHIFFHRPAKPICFHLCEEMQAEPVSLF